MIGHRDATHYSSIQLDYLSNGSPLVRAFLRYFDRIGKSAIGQRYLTAAQHERRPDSYGTIGDYPAGVYTAPSNIMRDPIPGRPAFDEFGESLSFTDLRDEVRRINVRYKKYRAAWSQRASTGPGASDARDYKNYRRALAELVGDDTVAQLDSKFAEEAARLSPHN